jgi:hypothetical protein
MRSLLYKSYIVSRAGLVFYLSIYMSFQNTDKDATKHYIYKPVTPLRWRFKQRQQKSCETTHLLTQPRYLHLHSLKLVDDNRLIPKSEPFHHGLKISLLFCNKSFSNFDFKKSEICIFSRVNAKC